MSTIAMMFCFDVPRISRIEGTPCRVALCPMCRTVHRLPDGHGQIVRAECPSSADDPKRPRADYWSLINAGPALREIVLAFETDGQVSQAILDQLAPREAWWPFQTIDFDPLSMPNPFDGDLEAQREMGDEFVEVLKRGAG